MTHRVVLAGSALLASAAIAAIAVAQTGGSSSAGGSATNPDSGQRGIGIPEGPFVNFCPSPEQGELHLQLYDFDYKPTVACNREGRVPPPSKLHPPEGDDSLSGATLREYHDSLVQSAKPAPDRDGDPTTIEGTLPDGRGITIFHDTATPERYQGMDIDDYARVRP